MGNAASSLPYTIGEEIRPSNGLGAYGFSMHVGLRKSDKKPVTVFKGEKSSLSKTPLVRVGSNMKVDPSLTLLYPALHHYKKCKTLLHPHVLAVHATLDTDYPDGNEPKVGSDGNSMVSYSGFQQIAMTGDLIIVTEACVPLDDYLDELEKDSDLNEQQREDAVAWGIYCIIQAMDFLHNTAKVAHGNLCSNSIFVTPGGDWKLSSFHLLTPIGAANNVSGASGGPSQHFRHFERDVTPMDYRSPERVEGRWDAISTSPVHTMDSYSMGILLPSIYKHYGAGTSGRLPQKLEKAVQRLCVSSITTRPRIIPLSKCPIFSTPHVEAQKFLDSVATQDVESKISFWKSLPDLFTKKILSSRTAKYKILPILQHTITTLTTVDPSLTQDVTKRECLAIIPILFNIATGHLSKEEFQASLSNVVELLFKVADRGVRGAMLSRISLFSDRFDNITLNRIVFENMVSGFSDTSAPLRELTLKSAVILVPFLTQPNLEKLTRYLVRLQNDPEDSIRTNTVIFIGKVAPNLSQMARSKLILPAFTRSMSDSFIPCRLAGLKAVCACRSLFEEKKLATEVLPSVVPSLVDPSEQVRMEAFQAVEEILIILRNHGKKMSQEEQKNVKMQTINGTSSQTIEMAPPSGIHSSSGMVAAAPSSSSSYLSGLSSWMTSSVKRETAERTSIITSTKMQTSNGTNSFDTTDCDLRVQSNLNIASPAGLGLSSVNSPDYISGEVDAAGWSDDDFDPDSLSPKIEKPKPFHPSLAIGNDDDFFGVFEEKMTMKSRPVSISNMKPTVAPKIASLKIEKKVGVKKLPLDVADGWDDF